MSYAQINQSYDLSHNKTLLLSYQEVPEDKDTYSYSNESDFFDQKVLDKGNFKVIVVVRMKKSSRSKRKLEHQNNNDLI